MTTREQLIHSLGVLLHKNPSKHEAVVRGISVTFLIECIADIEQTLVEYDKRLTRVVANYSSRILDLENNRVVAHSPSDQDVSPAAKKDDQCDHVFIISPIRVFCTKCKSTFPYIGYED